MGKAIKTLFNQASPFKGGHLGSNLGQQLHFAFGIGMIGALCAGVALSFLTDFGASAYAFYAEPISELVGHFTGASVPVNPADAVQASLDIPVPQMDA